MKNILITCALSVEMKSVKQIIKGLKYPHFCVDFLLTGVGNYNTIYSIKDYLERKSKIPDFIVNIGVCGKRDESVSNDFFQVYRIKNSANSREVLPPVYIKFGDLRSILSTEKVITDSEDMFGEEYVDMESYGVDFIATKEKIPFIIIKKPFDIVSSESKKVNLKQLEGSLLSFDYQNIFEKIEVFLETNRKDDKKESRLEYYKNYFHFTFSEFEIFKKNYNKFIAYKINFEEFFAKNKSLNKKDFLEQVNEV